MLKDCIGTIPEKQTAVHIKYEAVRLGIIFHITECFYFHAKPAERHYTKVTFTGSFPKNMILKDSFLRRPLPPAES